MAGKCDLQEKISELSNLLQSEKDLQATEQLRATEREKDLHKEICDLKEQLQRERNECADSFVPKLKVSKPKDVSREEKLQTEDSDCKDILGPLLEALERDNMKLFSQKEQLQMGCKQNNLASKEISEKDEAESAEEVTVMQQEDVCAQKELKTSEGDNVLQQQTPDLEEKLQTEGSEGLDTLGTVLEDLERESMVLTAQLQMSCIENDLTSKDVSEKDEAESAEEVTVMQEEDKIQEPDSLVQNENDVCAQEELKTSEGGHVHQQQTPDWEDKLQAEGLDSLDTLEAILKALQRENMVLSSEVEQLKMSFERMAAKYMAEKKEKEALQNIIQELNIKLQNEMDLCTQQQLKASERENVLCREIDDLRETLQKERDEDSKLQTWEQEKKAYLQEMEDLKLCYEGKTLRFNDMFEKLKAEKAHKEAIKEEQFKKIQALNIKVRQQQDTLIQQKVKASEREKMLSLKLEELEEKISCYEKGACPELTVRFNTEDDSLTHQAPKHKKKRKGWKKVAYSIKPWHWGKK